MLRVLLAENSEAARRRIKLLLGRIPFPQGVPRPSVVEAKNYQEGKANAELGVYPFAIVDLNLPDPNASAAGGAGRFPGLKLIAQLRARNRNIRIVAFSNYSSENLPELVQQGVHAALQKTQSDKEILAELQKLISKVCEDFNFGLKVHANQAFAKAFPGGGSCGTEDQWDLCLRRLFCTADMNDRVSYGRLNPGFSGASVIVAYVGPRLPAVLKLGQFEKLEDEARRYVKFVQHYIPNRTVTSRDDLAQAGIAGVLAYSFVGAAGKPTTLGNAVEEGTVKLDHLIEAIREHFETNCRRWFAEARVEQPFPINEKVREHFGADSNAIRNTISGPLVKRAFEKVAKYVGESTAEGVCDEICRAILAERNDIFCKFEIIVHGDLNVNNLIWDGRALWMIDFAKTSRDKPRVLDFVKLEASIKFDISNSGSGARVSSATFADFAEAERQLSTVFRPDLEEFKRDSVVGRKVTMIKAIRDLAFTHLGQPDGMEYILALFMVTTKHIEYAAKEPEDDRLMHAIFSAYLLAKMLHSNEAK